MRNRVLPLLAFLLLFSVPAFAGFEEGKKAYDTKDWVHAIVELRPLAEAGDDRAMMLLGNMYSNGYGVIKSYREAMSLYKRAAVEKSNPEAMLAVAGIYTAGLYMDQNLNAAKQWFERASLLGSQQAQLFLATILFQGNARAGDVIEPDSYDSYKWFKIAAKGTQFPEIALKAGAIGELIAKRKLKPEEIAKADKEVADWKPLDAAHLGPVPADPPEMHTAPPKPPEDKKPAGKKADDKKAAPAPVKPDDKPPAKPEEKKKP